MDEMNIAEKVAYIKGLAEGLNLDETTKEGKLIAAMLDVLGDIAAEIDDIEDVVAEMGDQVDAVDEDLSEVEELVYGDDDCGCGCGCDCDDDCHCCDDDCFEVECPACHDVIYLDGETLEKDGIDCPNCGTRLEFDFDGCDCDDCCCDQDDE